MPSAPSPRPGHVVLPSTRREFLLRAGAGFGGLALTALMARDAAAGNPLGPKVPHALARAKSVIWCFLDGGPSHLDLFDPKPALLKLQGKPLPPSIKRPNTAMGVTAHTPLMASRRKFRRHGQSGAWVSDWYPEIASCVDDIAFLRGYRADGQT